MKMHFHDKAHIVRYHSSSASRMIEIKRNKENCFGKDEPTPFIVHFLLYHEAILMSRWSLEVGGWAQRSK